MVIHQTIPHQVSFYGVPKWDGKILLLQPRQEQSVYCSKLLGSFLENILLLKEASKSIVKFVEIQEPHNIIYS